MDGPSDLSRFGVGGMVSLVESLRDQALTAVSVQDYAQRLCETLRAAFVGTDGEPQTALVRCYVTAPVAGLPEPERPDLPDDTICLTLLGTTGAMPTWCDRLLSVSHRVLPLVDPDQVAQMPMIAALLEQLGVDLHALTAAQPDVMLKSHDGTCRIFYVPDATGSPLVPAQDFVADHGIVSAIGFGGALPGGEVFAVVMFCTVAVPMDAAELFETVALSVSLASLDLLRLPLLPGCPAERLPAVTPWHVLTARAEITHALLRAHENASAREAERAHRAVARAEYDASRAAALAAVAMRLGNVRSVADVTAVLVEDGLSVLGADGVSVALTEESGTTVRVTVSAGYGPEVAEAYATLPLDDGLPTTLTARTGQVVLVPDLLLPDAAFPNLRAVAEDVGVRAAASYPLRVDDRLIGALTCTWSKPHHFDDAGLEVIGALAAQAAQAIDRARLLEREREHSTALQRSLLSDPHPVAGCSIAVRYQPAQETAEVGGDWYDAFALPDGRTMLVIGDVVGHDTLAAASMGQVRGLLRGIAWHAGGGPVEVLSGVDGALAGLGLDVTATALVAVADRGGCVRWSSAGHPAAALAAPDGTIRHLPEDPDLMLGVEPGIDRHEHDLVLPPGATLLLFTDGLVERRGEALDVGLGRLEQVLREVAALPLEELCDALLERLLPGAEDDIALLALRRDPDTLSETRR